MNKEICKLILNTFDGQMKNLKLKPKCVDSKVEFNIKYYNEFDEITDAVLIFNRVIAIDFEINYFDNYIGSELFGTYEIMDRKYKIDMIEKIFQNRLKHYSFHGYDYDENDEDDLLNCRREFNKILKDIDAYHLYEQRTMGGVFSIIAKEYFLKNNIKK